MSLALTQQPQQGLKSFVRALAFPVLTLKLPLKSERERIITAAGQSCQKGHMFKVGNGDRFLRKRIHEFSQLQKLPEERKWETVE